MTEEERGEVIRRIPSMTEQDKISAVRMLCESSPPTHPTDEEVLVLFREFGALRSGHGLKEGLSETQIQLYNELRGYLAGSHLRIANSLFWEWGRIRKDDGEVDDILVRCVDNFDASQGSTFHDYLRSAVINSIKRRIRDSKTKGKNLCSNAGDTLLDMGGPAARPEERFP